MLDLPTPLEIHDEIEKCRKNALKDALRLGLIEKKDTKNIDLSCKINPCVEKLTAKKNTKRQTENSFSLQANSSTTVEKNVA